MAKFIRKINKQGVWKKDGLSLDPDKILEQIPSDVFSRCMDSKDNTLSIWEVNGDDWADYNDVIATIVSGSDGPNATDLVILEDDIVNQIEIKQVDGDTPASQSMNKLHYDLINLTHFKIGLLAKYIGLKLAEDLILQKGGKGKPKGWGVVRITERKLIDIMKKALDNGCIEKDALSERWQKHLSKLEGSKVV